MCSWWRCGKAASQVFRVTLEQGDMRDTNKKERVLAKADLNLTRKKKHFPSFTKRARLIVQVYIKKMHKPNTRASA